MIRRFVSGFRARLAAATARERAALAVLGALAAVVAALSSFEWALQSGEAEHRARQRRVDIEAAFAQASDAEVQERIGIDTARVWSWSIVDASEALARTQAIELAQLLAMQAGLANVEVTDAAVSASEGAIGSVSVQLSADFDWMSFLALTEGLEQLEQGFSIEALEVSEGADEPARVVLTLSAPFLLEPPS